MSQLSTGLLIVFLGGLGPADKEASDRLIIIAPRGFHDSLKDYVKHKERQLQVRLVDLDEALRSAEGSDEPERLKRYLHDFWTSGRKEAGVASPPASRGRDYILLVGDADVLPVRYMVLDRITPPAFDYAFYPSDLYYGDLARADGSFDDWNSKKEGFHGVYYGEVRGEKWKDDPINFDSVHYIPEAAVGRWPVSTPEEVARVAAKTMRYEEGILSGERVRPRLAAFAVVGGWVDCRGLMDRLSSGLPKGWTAEKRYYGGGSAGQATPPPNAEEIVRLLNDGVALLCHAGHGQDVEWEGSFGLRHLPKVRNADRLPVIFSAGCSTARFATLPPYEPYVDSSDREHQGTNGGEVFKEPPPPPAVYQKGRYNPPGLGEELLRRGTDGAVAYIGCNTGSQPCGLSLVEGFVLGLSEVERPRVGDLWMHAVAHYHRKERLAELKPTPDWYPASIFFQGMKFMLFGDPSLLVAQP